MMFIFKALFGVEPEPQAGVGVVAGCVAAAALPANAHGFIRGRQGTTAGAGAVGSIFGAQIAKQTTEVSTGIAAVIWEWIKKLAVVSFIASMIAIGQYIFSHFTKKWEAKGLSTVGLAVMQGAGMGGVRPSQGGTAGLLGGPVSSSSAQVRPGMTFNEYRD